MTCSTPPATAQRNYVLRLIKQLLAWETSISHGSSPPFPMDELNSRLILCDRLLTAPLQDLATLGFPTPLPSAATILRMTLTGLERRAGLTPTPES